MIRNAVPADQSALETIQRDSLASPWPELLDTAVQALDLDLKGPLCLVATPSESNTPVGYVLAVEGHPPEESDSYEGTEGQCYVAEIAVAADHRRERYGSALLTAVVDRTDAEEVVLTARANADATRSFYIANSFRVVERLSGYYDSDGEPEDGLLFSKRV
ncbi:GNAT family N-acetyltransferase [Halocatena pleomorpha]|uniref:N-acetyltransferase n=1 Tax=Halocatena pleomorpha TaxID=1785090 RepID=A0A3P3R5C4_9EURY|nr:N-acetyltransferase [Halocatena pleomorpha]RRJ28168.1 N-acetyltransferase [Halocatena pleomorpha]